MLLYLHSYSLLFLLHPYLWHLVSRQIISFISYLFDYKTAPPRSFIFRHPIFLTWLDFTPKNCLIYAEVLTSLHILFLIQSCFSVSTFFPLYFIPNSLVLSSCCMFHHHLLHNTLFVNGTFCVCIPPCFCYVFQNVTMLYKTLAYVIQSVGLPIRHRAQRNTTKSLYTLPIHTSYHWCLGLKSEKRRYLYDIGDAVVYAKLVLCVVKGSGAPFLLYSREFI